jgi:alpha-mannosidase
MPAKWGLLEISPANVVLSALKPAADGATVLRVYEASGKTTTNAMLKLFARVKSVESANLMEDSGTALKVQNDAVRFDLHPFEIKTLKLHLENQTKRAPNRSAGTP